MLMRMYYRLTEGEEACFYVEYSEKLSDGQVDILTWLIKETFGDEEARAFSHFPSATEIGPQLTFETPFSANAVAGCNKMGIPQITRIEQSTRYAHVGRTREEILVKYLDPMTEMEYPTPLASFTSEKVPDPVRTIDLLGGGMEVLVAFNKEHGLGMDADDLRFTFQLFVDLGRNPTDVELYQLANMNSEHSRHHYFKGVQIIDGVHMPKSLLTLIQDPWKGRSSTRSLVAFRDNSGVIQGSNVQYLMPFSPGYPSPFMLRKQLLHITATAETHNHPTLVAPYPGAATGAGGRIRDTCAVGRGGIIGAGLAGYAVGNLHIPGYLIPGENIGGEVEFGYATPLQILIEGSNGISDYGNKIGEPLIGGFTRSFGLMVNGERREYRKPILWSGGIGRLFDDGLEKETPTEGMYIVRLGGPAYSVGVAGGSASSMTQGASTRKLDLASVQRGNPQEENRVNRAIRSSMELGIENPILSIHDQGAGGPSNVLTELLEPVGGRIEIRKITCGDKTMSVLHIWTAEFQESYGVLARQDGLEILRAICERERVLMDVVGLVSNTGAITVFDSESQRSVVELPLEQVLSRIPTKTFTSEHLPCTFKAPQLPPNLSIDEAFWQVLKLPSVGSKGYLTRKVDRSVTGLVARQQCCGPAHIPVADVSVTADGYFGKTGAASAIGEQPIKMLIDPKSGARMSFGEMITNLACAKVTDLKDVTMRANWMWPAKFPGEGALLYDAATALSETMFATDTAADGGKDSLSMAATVDGSVVKAPGTLVILGYALMKDITQVRTPDFLWAGESQIGFIDLGNGKCRLGGSALLQSLGQVGDVPPDLDDPKELLNAFEFLQNIIEEGLVGAMHNVSDGGLITTLTEMCLAGNCGARVEFLLHEPMRMLFAEELGIVFEYLSRDAQKIQERASALGVSWMTIGKTEVLKNFTIANNSRVVFSRPLTTLRAWWESTSYEIELLQSNPETAREEHMTYFDEVVIPALTFKVKPQTRVRGGSRPKVAILREEGTNGDREMAAACYGASLDPHDISMNDLLNGNATLDQFRGVVFPGGFSYMDVFGSAKSWAGVIKFNPILLDMFGRFYDRSDTFSLGVCNGFQVMTLLGAVPFRGLKDNSKQPRLVRNRSRRFESRWTYVRVEKSPSVMLSSLEGSMLGVWSAHGEGQVVFPDEGLHDHVVADQLIPLRYVTHEGVATEEYPYNPNGSRSGIAALCSPDGRHLGMMPHPERSIHAWQWPWMPGKLKAEHPVTPWLRMFENARVWCLQNQS